MIGKTNIFGVRRMSEPSNFERLQKHFRFVKETHGVDLTTPQGVGIDGKVYPATHKLLTMGHTSKFDEEATESRFYIPLENGLKVHASTYVGRHGSLSMQMYVPTIHLDGDGGKSYRYGMALHKGEDSYSASFGENPNNFDENRKDRPNPFYEEHMSLHNTRGPISNVHEVLNMWGKEPYQGTYDFEGKGIAEFKKIRPNADITWADRDGLELTEDELNEHRQNAKFHPGDASHNVTVYGVYTDHAFYNYNTKTEQLRPYNDVFETPSKDRDFI